MNVGRFQQAVGSARAPYAVAAALAASLLAVASAGAARAAQGACSPSATILQSPRAG